jgi:hypothetical protein
LNQRGDLQQMQRMAVEQRAEGGRYRLFLSGERPAQLSGQ